jgi:hypothetical protein
MQQILGVAIGIATVCLVLSIIASHVQEVIAAITSRRAVMLELAIKKMLNDDQLYSKLVSHPLIQNISFNLPDGQEREAHDAADKSKTEGRPSYIASPLFSRVLLTLLATQHNLAVFDFPGLIAAMPDSKLRDRLQTLIFGIEGNAAACQAAVEAWYDGTMERVNGFYKRRTQGILLVIGLALAILCNADLFRITSTLWLAKDARDSVAALSKVYGCRDDHPCTMPEYVQVRQALEEKLNPLPLGYEKGSIHAYWSHLVHGQDASGKQIGLALLAQAGLSTLMGWLLTAVAVSLGAPFWFDLLNNLLKLNPRIVGAKPLTGLEMRAAVIKAEIP